jgi:hypothetical protein
VSQSSVQQSLDIQILTCSASPSSLTFRALASTQEVKSAWHVRELVSLATLLFRHPYTSLKFSYCFIVQVLLVLLRRILLLRFPSYQSLRIQLQKAYLSSASLTFPNLTHRLPVTACPERRARSLAGTGWTGYVIPGNRNLSGFIGDAKQGARCVVLYAQGGGYARGEVRMYLNYMERWVKVAAGEGR